MVNKIKDKKYYVPKTTSKYEISLKSVYDNIEKAKRTTNK